MSKWPRDTVLAHSHSHLPRLNVHQAGQASPCLCLIHKTRALEPGGVSEALRGCERVCLVHDSDIENILPQIGGS